MAVLFRFEVHGNNIFDRLKSLGAIHPGKIFSPRRKEYVEFENILDYRKCGERAFTRANNILNREIRRLKNNILNDPDLSEERKQEIILNNEKCDAYLMPVRRTEEGGISWTLSYDEDDLPSIVIGRMFPDEIFDYKEYMDGTLVASLKFKDMETVN